MDDPVARYFDRQFGLEAVKILPGQYYSARRDIVIVTVLGSCVSACLWDPALRIGGMNHFMLPGAAHAAGASGAAAAAGGPDPARLGIYAMELLINQLLKLGAERSRLVAKVFGGGSVLEGLDTLNIGNQNGAFVLGFLREEGIPLAAQDLYDVCARKVYFFPRSGKVLVKRIGEARNDTVEQRERDYLAQLARAPLASEVEIFADR
jgi:chemotaxis protein CheD